MKRFLLLATTAWLLAGCAADPPMYAACREGGACEGSGASACYQLRLRRSDGTEARGGVCSIPCERDEDCPQPALCIALADDPGRTFFCVARCDGPQDCIAPHRCTELEGEGRGLRACLP